MHILNVKSFLALATIIMNAEISGHSIEKRSLKSVPTTVKTNENDTVLLPCYSTAPILHVNWHRDGELLVDSRQETEETSPTNRFYLWPNGSLQVTNVNAEDTGEYVCEITNTAGSYKQIHDIEVEYRPSVIFSPSGTVELPVGSVLEVICDAKGVPYPVIKWHMKNVPHAESLENKKRILIEIMSRDMSGPIECVANNGVGEPVTVGAYLNVLFAPDVIPTSKAVHTKIGMQATLECLVTSAPAANVHWFLNGKPIKFDSQLIRNDHEIRSNKSAEEYITESQHILIFKRVRDVDLGIYECRAENKVGFKGGHVALTGKPKMSVFKTLSPVSSPLEHNLIWVTESLSPLIEYRLRFRQVVSGNVTPENRKRRLLWNEIVIPGEYSEGPVHSTSYKLRGLQPASVYEVCVSSRNRYGWSDYSNTIRFASGGEVELSSQPIEMELQSQTSTDTYWTEETSTDVTDFAFVANFEKSFTSGSSVIYCSIHTATFLMFYVFYARHLI